MKAINKGGKIKAKSSKKISWRYFDSMPPKIKEIIKNSPLPLQVRNVKKQIKTLGVERYAEMLQKQITEITRKSCEATYGPDHPQSR